MKKLSALVALMLALSLFAACGGGSPASSSQAVQPSETTGEAAEAPSAEDTGANEDDFYIAVITKSFAGDFWKACELGAKEAGEQLGIQVTIEGPDTETEFEQQIKMIENAVQKGADAIVLSTLDSKAMVPVVEEAAAKGVKIITFNSILESDVVISHVATDNWAAGELAGEQLAQAIDSSGKVAIIGAVEGVKNNRDRSDGAAEVLAKYDDIELVGIQYADGDMNKAISIATDYITANPDLAGFFSNNDVTSIAVATVLKERGMEGKIKHIGFDASTQTIAQVEDEITDGFVTQDPYRMGYLSVEKALQALKGDAVEASVDTGCVFVNLDNIADPDIEKVLYPFGK